MKPRRPSAFGVEAAITAVLVVAGALGTLFYFWEAVARWF